MKNWTEKDVLKAFEEALDADEDGMEKTEAETQETKV